MTIRYNRYLFRLGYVLAGSTILLLSIADPSMAAASILFFFLLSFRLAPLVVCLETLLFRYARCRACGIHFDLVDRWRCRCGYISSAFRHVFRGCVRCKTRAPYVFCPRCSVSVDL